MTNIWNFIVAHHSIIVPCITAVLSAIVSIHIANKNAKKEMKKLEKQYELNFQEYVQHNMYDIKMKAIFKTLTFLDNYHSWLTIDGKKPIRKDTSTLELTLCARECYNELCLTCDNEKLIETFNKILFREKKGGFLSELSEFRKIARDELQLSQIQMDSNVSFISQVSTDDLFYRESQ